jgi:hypothetical protein
VTQPSPVPFPAFLGWGVIVPKAKQTGHVMASDTVGGQWPVPVTITGLDVYGNVLAIVGTSPFKSGLATGASVTIPAHCPILR